MHDVEITRAWFANGIHLSQRSAQDSQRILHEIMNDPDCSQNINFTKMLLFFKTELFFKFDNQSHVEVIKTMDKLDDTVIITKT